MANGKVKRETAPPTLYTDSSEFVAAIVAGDLRWRFHCIVTNGYSADGLQLEFWWFAASQHQFDAAVTTTLCTSTTKLNNSDIQKLIGDEFAKLRAAKETA